MTSTVEHGAETQHGHPAPRRRGIFMRPGYLRALWVTPLFFLIGMYIVVGIRAPTINGSLRFIVGAGRFMAAHYADQ